MKKTAEIIGTIGPASARTEVMAGMIEAGMDVARLNFSHGSVREHEDLYDRLKAASRKAGRNIRVLQDLEGFRIRIGAELGGSEKLLLGRGEVLRLVKKSFPSKRGEVPFDYEGPLTVIPPGEMIYIDGGKLALRVERSQEDALTCVVIEGGTLTPRKGVNIPGVDLPFGGLTEKDRRDLEFLSGREVAFLAQSFVRDGRDVKEVKDLVKDMSPATKVVAKVECRTALNNLENIIEQADGVMIARGDLGISIPLWEVPLVQKQIIAKSHSAGKFAITATEMLESMTHRKRPSRAEVSDVANAILDGSDYVMLSEETAIGAYPAGAVEMMQNIIDHTTENRFGKAGQ